MAIRYLGVANVFLDVIRTIGDVHLPTLVFALMTEGHLKVTIKLIKRRRCRVDRIAILWALVQVTDTPGKFIY